jgi:STE24 endopeptidase
MNTFTTLFLATLAAATLVQLWLARRQQGYVTAHRAQVPAAFAERISLEDHRKAADYTVSKTRLGMVELGYDALLLLGWTLGGGLQWLDHVWRAAGFGPVATGVGFMLSVMVIMTALELPFGLYHVFVIEERYGFNRTTPRLFVTDLLKQFLLTLLIGTPLIAIALWIMLHSGGLWWLHVWLVWMAFSLVMFWAYPALIAPLFNRFSPLDNESLKARIQTLLDKCGFRSQGIFVMDGSRRSGHGNAYFTGFGRNKRIVFFDTLLSSLEPGEIEAVLAHELGHFKLKHIQKRLFATAAFSLAGLALLGWLSSEPWFYRGLGASQASPHMALVLFMLAAPPFTFFLSPLLARLSRRHEFEADAYAVNQSSGDDLTRALVKMYRENASTLTPDPLYSAFHDSHPPAAVRIAHISGTMHHAPQRGST